jgi:hypothetical protein
MPPEARQKFRRNAERWLQMSPAERDEMRHRENLRRETIRRQTEAALRQSGLRLNPQERAQFESRYIQERKKVERTLRQQIEAERQKEIPARSTSQTEVRLQNRRSRLNQKSKRLAVFFLRCLAKRLAPEKGSWLEISSSQLRPYLTEFGQNQRLVSVIGNTGNSYTCICKACCNTDVRCNN